MLLSVLADSYNRELIRTIARQVKPVTDALFKAFGGVLLGVAIIIALLLLIDWLVGISKSKKQKAKTVPQPVVKPEVIQHPEPVVPIEEEKITELTVAPEKTVIPPETIIETEEQPVFFSLPQDIETLSDGFRKKCADKNLSFSVEVDDRMPAKITGKKVWLNDLLEQLFDMALQQTKKGGITLKAKMVKGSDKASTVQFLFTDTGDGLPPSLLRAVQERDFVFQLEDVMLQSVLMRLHEVKKSVEKEKGRLTLATKSGEGSTIGVLVEFAL